MQIVKTIQAAPGQKQAILRLWNNEYPAQLGFQNPSELEDYLNGLLNPAHYFAVHTNGQVSGWAFAFDRAAERWFAIIIDSSQQGTGLGTLLLEALKKEETILNGWAIDHHNYIRSNNMPYVCPIPFYQKNGFSVCTGTRLETEKLSAVKISWQQTP